MTKKILLGLALVAVLGMVAVPVFAQVKDVIPAPSQVQDVPSLLRIVYRVIDILFTILIVGAIFFIMMAAFKYLTAGGNPEKVSEAGKDILYAGGAIVVGAVAKGVPAAVCLALDIGCKIT